MIAKAKAISHGSSLAHYVLKAERNGNIVASKNLNKENLILAQAAGQEPPIWDEMRIHQVCHGHQKLKNNIIRIEVSPTIEESKNFTDEDWGKLAEEVLQKMDKQSITYGKGKDKKRKTRNTNLYNSQWVAMLHRDSKSGIPHLHIIVNRVDMNGNISDDKFIGKKAVKTANDIGRERGWRQAKDVHNQKREILNNLDKVLRSMQSFDWDMYAAIARERFGYKIDLKRSNTSGLVVNYTVTVGNNKYKASDIHRYITARYIEERWKHVSDSATMFTPFRPDKNKPNPIKQRAEEWARQEIKNKIDTREDRQQHLSEYNNNRNTIIENTVHHDIDVNGKNYSVDISKSANDIIMSEAYSPRDNEEATNFDASKIAILLFAGYIDAATNYCESCGGGGGVHGELSSWDGDDDKARNAAHIATNSLRPKSSKRSRKR